MIFFIYFVYISPILISAATLSNPAPTTSLLVSVYVYPTQLLFNQVFNDWTP